MVADRLFGSTLSTVVGATVVSRAVDTGLGRRNSPRSNRTTGRSGESTGRHLSGKGKAGAGGGGTTHYPANKIKTLCGRKLKDINHSRIKKNVDCKRCRKILKTLGKL